MPGVPVPLQRGAAVPSSRAAVLLALVAIALFAFGCGDDEDDSGEAGETVSAESCTPEELDTIESGVLTVGTDKPAFPPYFEDNDPTNGEGFESATAYAIADELGYEAADVEWVTVPFNSSYAPGPKDFDFDINQISISPKRAENVDFSTPYYEAEQAIVALKDSAAADAASLADLTDAEIGVQIGTTSLEAVEDQIQPANDPEVFQTSNDVVSALKNEQVEAIVVDVPTAFFLTAVQAPEAAVVGQFSAPGGDEWGVLLERDSSLTPCVSDAIQRMIDSGELEEIENKWMSQATKAPVLE
jgi:polar amino acid transport system substrate-binding protein